MQLPDNEWCLQCSNWVDELHPLSGWCFNCTKKLPTDAATTDYIETERWLNRYANHLEHYLLAGLSFHQAVRFIRDEVRPACLSCGAFIKRGPRESIFCTKNDNCKKARNRYQYLYKQKGLSKPRALDIVITEFNLS